MVNLTELQELQAGMIIKYEVEVASFQKTNWSLLLVKGVERIADVYQNETRKQEDDKSKVANLSNGILAFFR